MSLKTCDNSHSQFLVFYFFSDMATSTDNQARIALFQSIGLNEQKARETLKNTEVTRVLETTINEVPEFFVFA